MPKIESFEKHSNDYDQWFDDHMDFYVSELETIRRLIPPSGTKGLEVGVGTGKFALPLGIRIGVDPSEKMAEKARLKGISVYSGVAEELPFSEEMFDFVLMVTTICFVDDVFRSFSEAFRVLKPGGAIVVGFIDKESCLGRQYAENKESSRFYKEAVFFSAPEVLGYLEEAGFIIKKILQTLIAGDKPSIIAEGFGKGTFVAIKGLKIKD